MGMCKKCSGLTAWMFLIVAALFLLVDLGMWDFWNVSWWTALFFIFALCTFGKGKCKDCK